MKSLFKSRKFLVLVGDVVSSLILYFAARFFVPDIVDDIKFLIVTVQPVYVLVIGGIAYEDGQLKRGMGSQINGD